MHSSNLITALFAAGALGGPVLGQKPHRVHMDLHNKKRDTPAGAALNELNQLSGGQFAGQAPPAVTDEVVVYTTVYEGEAPPATSTPPATTSSAAPAIKAEKKYGLAPVAPVGSPAPAASPAASPATGSSNSDTYPSAPAQFQSSMTADDEDYKNLVLVHHNIHRANHSLPLLVWNDTLFTIAKNSAQSCVYAHTPEPIPYGQNIAAGNAPGNVSADITNGFYNGEIDLFGQAIGSFGQSTPDMTNFEKWGHATQILWKDTTSVACYTASCAPAGADPLQCGPSGSYLKNVGCGNGGVRAFNLVCNYYPPGNYPGKYNEVPASANKVAFVEMTDNGVTGLPASLPN